MNMNSGLLVKQKSLSAFYARVYSLVSVAVGVSALTSLVYLYMMPQSIVYAMQNIIIIFMMLIIQICLATAARFLRDSKWSIPIFVGYSGINGFVLSIVISKFTQGTVFAALISSTLLFSVMALIGVIVKRDLSGILVLLIPLIIGVIIASIVNWYLVSDMVSLVISYVSVVIFSCLVAYDNQKIKQAFYENGYSDRSALDRAMALYLDLINIFLDMLTISK